MVPGVLLPLLHLWPWGSLCPAAPAWPAFKEKVLWRRLQKRFPQLSSERWLASTWETKDSKTLKFMFKIFISWGEKLHICNSYYTFWRPAFWPWGILLLPTNSFHKHSHFSLYLIRMFPNGDRLGVQTLTGSTPVPHLRRFFVWVLFYFASIPKRLSISSRRCTRETHEDGGSAGP